MSKFKNLCEKVERYIREENEDIANAAAPQPAPGEPQPGSAQQVINPEQEDQSNVQEVSNDKLEKLIQTLVTYFQNGKTLSADDVKKIQKEIPSTINSENSDKAVDTFMSIFQSSDFPEDTSSNIKTS
jgi:uncharacterized protein YpuA (DUF1002 family)